MQSARGLLPRGFTLIEVLVVIAITATLTALVVLRLGDLQDPDDPQRVLERVAARVNHQCEQALFQARPRGLRFGMLASEGGVRTDSEIGYDAWQSSAEGWQVLPQQGPDQAQVIPEGLTVELMLGGYAVDLSAVELGLDLQFAESQAANSEAGFFRANDNPARRPQIVCEPLGELTPFRLSLSQAGQRWTLEGQAGGHLRYELPDT